MLALKCRSRCHDGLYVNPREIVPPDRVNHLAAEVLRDSGTILGRTIRLDEQQRLVLRGWEGDSRGRQANHEWGDFDNPVWPTLITIFGPPRPLGFQSES